MRFSPSYWWPFARTVWGWIVASLTILAALYYGPKKMFEAFAWYMYQLVDYKVRDFLESSVVASPLASPQTRDRLEVKTAAQIAGATGLSEKRVKGCLKRLRDKGVVKAYGQDGWRAA